MAEAQVRQAAELELERKLGRLFTIGAPLATLAGALGVLAVYGAAPALLVLGAGALLWAVIALWTSLRSLTGDAPLEDGFDEGFVRARTSEAEERKRAVLRALKDLEHEKSVGKLDDADYAALSAQLRARAKAILRDMDDELAPLREKAEKLARDHLRKKGLDRTAPPRDERAPDAAPAESDRAACPKCATDNESDAVFCKKCGARVREPAVAAEEES